MKPFDERFADRVRDEFDAYQEAVDPVALEQIRHRLRGGQGIVPFITWKALAAASILLIAGTALWMTWPWTPSAPPEMASADRVERPDPAVQPPAATGIPPAQTRERSQSDPDSDGRPVSESMAGADAQIGGEVPVQQNDVMPDITPPPAEVHNRVESSSQKDAGDRSVVSLQKEITEESEVIKPGVFETENTTVRPLPALTLPVLAAGDNIYTSASGQVMPVVPQAEAGRSPRGLGITAGSMVTYAGSQFAGGAGFFAGAIQDWQLTESLSLSSGGLLAWNRFSYEPEGAMLSEGSFFRALSTNSAVSSELDVDVDYDARREFSWLAVDIPLNMNWDVGGNSRGRYNLTIGLSSLIYLQQSFREEGVNYTGRLVRNEEFGTYDIDIQSSTYSEREDQPAFSRFDFARLMNVAVGYSLRNKKNPLSFELYLKYPLGNLTSREISMGMGGISMRYSLGR
ncbi:MAG: hypothetical protein EA364_05365 [Balneolaceae bacterium]|nr:MAG: hypothetical protein EA364_05365 [Balneolaceae bacterium]